MALPTGYRQVEYILSSGTQFIDTEFYPNSNTRIVLEFNASNAVCVFGAYDTGGAKGCGLQNVSNKCYQYYGSSSGASSTAFKLNARMVVDWNKNVLIVDGTTARTATASTFTCSYPLYVFALNHMGAYATGYSSMMLYHCQIYDNGTIVRDFVPCIDPSDVVGMYDTVNDRFYTNAGSGSFTAGPVVNAFNIPGYVNVDGVHKAFVGGYVNVDGTLKKLLYGYQNVGGTLVLLTKKKSLFTWKKHAVVKTNTYEVYDYGEKREVVYKTTTQITAYKNISVDTSGNIILTDSVSVTGYNGYSSYYQTYPYVKIGDMVIMYKGYIYGAYYGYEQRTRITGTIDSIGGYVETVESVNETEYPNNGIHTDGYWYVKQ